MNRVVSFLALLLVTAPGIALAADCQPPGEAPQVPDGDTATKTEMVHAQNTIHGYLNAAQQFVDCVDENEDIGKLEISHMEKKEDQEARLKELNAARHQRNAVVEEMQTIANQFNAEIDKFQARQGGS